MLLAGVSSTIAVPGTISAYKFKYADVTAHPITADGKEILDLADVEYSNPFGVQMLPFTPSVLVASTVSVRNNGDAHIALLRANEFKNNYGYNGTYCLTVTNTGNTSLDQVVLADGDLAYNYTTLGRLAPGQSATISVLGKIKSNLTNKMLP